MSNIRQIKFSENWDKLKPENFRVGKTFTTFRSYSVSKHRYYIASKEKDDCFFDVVLKDKKIGVAKLLDVQPMISDYLTLGQIRKDTYPGFDRSDFQALLKKFYGLSCDMCGLWLTFEIIEVLMDGDVLMNL
jgi:hypothetical protein